MGERYLIWPVGVRVSSKVSLHSEAGSSATVLPKVANPLGVPLRLLSSNLQSAVAKESAFNAVAVVLRMTSSAKELPSSWARKFMPGVRLR